MSDFLIIQNINSKGYGIVPKLAMQDKRLTIEAKAIYSYFCSYAGAGCQAFPSVDKITFDLGINKKRFYRHLKLLKNFDYITVKQTKNKDNKFARNVYTLNTEVLTQVNIEEKPCTHFRTTENNDPCTHFGTTQNETLKLTLQKSTTITQDNNNNNTDKTDNKDNIDKTPFNKLNDDVTFNKLNDGSSNKLNDGVDYEFKNINDKLKSININISKNQLRKLINDKGIRTISKYIDNWDKFTCDKNNKNGFFVCAVKFDYPIPEPEDSYTDPYKYTNPDTLY